MTQPDAPESPAVSVIMPVHNGERHLAEAVESVLAQSFTDFEFLVIDDGSTDTTARMMRCYAEQDVRIRFVSRSNLGITPTLNELIASARAPLLARMDADDIAHPERLSQQVSYMNAHSKIAALGTACETIDDAGRKISCFRPPCEHAAIDELNIKGHAAFVHPSVMMRTEAIRSISSYDETFKNAQDIDLWLRLAEIYCLANLPNVLLTYRLAQNGISAKNVEQQSRFATLAVSNARERRGLPAMQMTKQSWRPGTDRKSREAFALKWAWQAWGSGHRSTARHYFWKALSIRPWSVAAIKGVIFGHLKRPKSKDL